MKVLILGGTWFIGKNITFELLNRGYDVWHFNRGKTPIKGVTLLKGNRFKNDTKSLMNHKFDSIIDLTCFSENDFYNTYKYLQHNFNQYILISPLNNDNSKYYINKRKVENKVKTLNNYIIIKLKNIVGDYDYSNKFYKKLNKWYLKDTNKSLSSSSYIDVKLVSKYVEQIIKSKDANKIYTFSQRTKLHVLTH